MIVKCVNLLSIMLILSFFVRNSHGEKYALNTPKGTAARIDIMNALKIALKLANVMPKSREYRAGYIFAKFLASAESDYYVEAFYAIPTDRKPNKFKSFLNGIIYNGDPGLLAWRAAKTLAEMIRTKVNSQNLETIRNMLKTSKSRGLPISPFKGKKQHLDFLDIFQSKQLVYMWPYMATLKQKDEGRKFLQGFEPENLPLFLQLMLENSYGDNSNSKRRSDDCSCLRRRTLLQQTPDVASNAFNIMYNLNSDDSSVFYKLYPDFMLE